jgi:two-component system, cell cycle sensor histidine kinase and response regulator CckA
MIFCTATIRQAAERRAIAERQRAEEYLRVAEVLIVELDRDGRIQRINPRGCTLLGRSQDQLVGCSWFETALPADQSKKSGNGLGLATAFSIMKRHDGTILVASQPGQGTTFTLYLPAAPTVVLTSAVPKAIRHRGHGSILVMDDERAVLDVTAQVLSSLGYTVLPARDGQEAIDLFMQTTQGEHDVVAVILDRTVPGGLGGKEAAAAIRQRHPSVPIFLVSGYAHDPIMATPQDHGFTDSLCKPFTRGQLVALLEKHCR